MRKVVILKPVDGFEPGATPEVFGPRGRALVAAGLAKWAPADKPARKRAIKNRKES